MNCKSKTDKDIIWLINNIWDSIFLHIRKALFWMSLFVLTFFASIGFSIVVLDYNCFDVQIIDNCCDND